MNLRKIFKLKTGEDETGPYFVIPPKLRRLLKLKPGSEATAKLVSSKGKLVFEITPN